MNEPDKVLALAAMALVLVLSAQVSPAHAQDPVKLTTLEATRRYHDLQQEIEKRLAAGAKPTTTLFAYLCTAYASLKNYAKLRDCLVQLDSRLAAGDKFVVSDDKWIDFGWNAQPLPGMLRADSFLELGQYQQSIDSAKALLAALPKMEIDSTMLWSPSRVRGVALSDLVSATVARGDKDQARRYATELENISVPFIGSAAASQEKSASLARAYMALGEYEKALAELKPGLGRALTGIVGDELNARFDLPRLLMRAKALTELGKLAEAKTILDQLLATPILKDIGDLHWVAAYERGLIAEKEQDNAKAAALFQTAVEVIEQQRSTINTEASKIGFIGDKQAPYAHLVAVLVAQGRAAEAFDYVERSKSRALVDILASKKDFFVHAPDPGKAQQLLAELDAADLASRVQSGTAKPGENAGARGLQTTSREIRQTAPELAALVTVTSIPPDELKSLIDEDESLVEYYYQDARLYIFVVDRQKLQVVAADAAGLDDQVRGLRADLEQVGSAKWQVQAQALYARLWQPVEGLVTGKNITVVAHGALHYLPFAVLRAPDGGLLIDQVSLRFLPSASVLKVLRPHMQSTSSRLLALGNPDLGGAMPNLPFAEDEASKVAGMSPDSRLLIRHEASETSFKKAGRIFPRIHFATHGKFQSDAPLNSGLYLTKDADNDGVLTVGELYSMDLDADLVTLSACETGLGKIASGDDVVGLTRGFLYAGSRSIVASLWSVDDKATGELMQNFYRNLPTLSKREALRQAQIATRKQFPHPFFWAAFQLTGRAD